MEKDRSNTEEILDRHGPLNLPRQLKLLLQHRIESGRYVAGKKMDSVRKLAAEFKVSGLTVQRALQELEQDGYTISVPGSGIYINDRFAEERSPVKMAFVFPEQEISPRILEPEDWAISSEIHRGLLSGARKYGAHLDFIHIDKHLDTLQLLRRTRLLSQYDSLFFTGEQLLELQLAMARQVQVFHLSAAVRDIPGLQTVDYDRERALRAMARHAMACGCRTVGTISFLKRFDSALGRFSGLSHNYFDERGPHFLQHCKELHLEISERHQLVLRDRSSLKEDLVRHLRRGCPDFLFCCYTDGIPQLYEACSELGIRIGQDMKIAAIATGFTFQGLVPALTHIQVPIFKLAEEAVHCACRTAAMSDPDDSPAISLDGIQADLIIGKSTVFPTQAKESAT